MRRTDNHQSQLIFARRHLLSRPRYSESGKVGYREIQIILAKTFGARTARPMMKLIVLGDRRLGARFHSALLAAYDGNEGV